MPNWKAIPDFPNYECSDTGEFRRNGKPLKTCAQKKGYMHIRLYRDGKQYSFRAHRLVYETFIGKIPKGLEINHLNGIKDDNSLSNLECCTHSQNICHAIQNRLIISRSGKDNALSKPLIGIELSTGKTIYFDSQADAKRSGFNTGNIQGVLTGKRSQHKGFVWRYAHAQS